MNIAIDIDGVLAKFTTPFQHTVNSLYPGKLEKDYLPEDFWYSDKLTKEEAHAALQETFKIHNLWANLEPWPEALELQSCLYSLNLNKVDIFYVTHRPETPGPSPLVQTHRWLLKHNLLRSNTSIVVVNASQAKSHLYGLLDIKYSIDDRSDTVKSCQNITNHSAYLLDRKWNQKDVELPRVRSMRQFCQIVLGSTAAASI